MKPTRKRTFASTLFIGLFGDGVVRWPTVFSVGLLPVIVLIYTLLARSEEKRMVEQFGDEYGAYRSQVPMFFPRAGQWRQFVGRSNSPSDDQK